MHFLLVNNNPAVSRLIVLSVEKLGFQIDEIPSFEDIPRESYDMVFINNVQYNEEMVDLHRRDGLTRHFVYIGARGESKPSDMDFVIEKPFLPTDFIDLVTKIDTDSNENISEPEEFIDDFELPKLKDDVDTFTDSEDSLTNSSDELDESEHGVIDLEEEDVPLDFSDLQENEIGLDEENLEESEKENNTPITEDENLASVLDNDDINEVKQLLEENNDDDYNLDTFENEDTLSPFEEERSDLNEGEKSEDKVEEVITPKENSEEDLAEDLSFPEKLEGDEDEFALELEEDFEFSDVEKTENTESHEDDFDLGDLELNSEEKVEEVVTPKEDIADDLDVSIPDNLETDEHEFAFEAEDLELSDAAEIENIESNEEDFDFGDLEEEGKEEITALGDNYFEGEKDEEVSLDESVIEKTVTDENDFNDYLQDESIPTPVEEIKNEDLTFEEPDTQQEDELLDEDNLEITFDEDEQESISELKPSENISTLDDLSESDFLSAFGKEIIEDNSTTIEENKESKNIQEEIQLAVSKSVKAALQSSSIKDSLKGMKVNISITFEDEE